MSVVCFPWSSCVCVVYRVLKGHKLLLSPLCHVCVPLSVFYCTCCLVFFSFFLPFLRWSGRYPLDSFCIGRMKRTRPPRELTTLFLFCLDMFASLSFSSFLPVSYKPFFSHSTPPYFLLYALQCVSFIWFGRSWSCCPRSAHLSARSLSN